MADDIVTRLRAAALSGDMPLGMSIDCAHVADQIERLRADLQEAYDACRYALASSPRWQENCATVIATWEADRG